MVAVCSAIAACGGQTLDSRQLDFNNGLVYKHGSTTPFTGTVLFKDSMPEPLVEYWASTVAANGDNSAQNVLTGCTAHYTNGLIDGSSECQGADGKTAVTINFKDEKYDGVSKIYNPQTVSLFKVIPWQAGAMDGEEKTYWFDTGEPHWEGHWSGGILNGAVKEWDHDGKVITDATFSNGSPVDGLVTDKKGAMHYKDGKPDGPAELFSPNGVPPLILSKGSYSQGERVGTWQDWGTNAIRVIAPFEKIMYSAFHLDDVEEPFFSFLQPDHTTSNWDNGSVQGEVVGFDKNGNQVFAINTQGGALNGPFTFRISARGDGHEALVANNPPQTITFQSNQPVGCIGDKLRTRLASNPAVMAETVDQWLAACSEGGASASVAQAAPSLAAATPSEKTAADAIQPPQAKATNSAAAIPANLPVAAPHQIARAANVGPRRSDGIRASFDCAKAESLVEKIICSNQMLADDDVRLMSSYKAAMAASPDKAAVKDAQRVWMAQRNACTTLDCVSRAYQLRIKQLDTSH